MRVNSFFKYLFIYSVSYDIIKLHLIFAYIDEKYHNTGGIIIMTVGENIRRIRQERGLTLKQLGEMVGVSEAYIRAYESGRRNPKLKSLEALAQALAVNVEVLTNSDFDGIKAMHRLFQVFRQYDGHLFEYQDQDGNDMVAVSFGTLSLMRSWCDRYEEYMKEVEKCNSIKDVKKRGEALLKAEADFNLWMDIYPKSEPFDLNLKIQKAHDETMDEIGLNPTNNVSIKT